MLLSLVTLVRVPSCSEHSSCVLHFSGIGMEACFKVLSDPQQDIIEHVKELEEAVEIGDPRRNRLEET